MSVMLSHRFIQVAKAVGVHHAVRTLWKPFIAAGIDAPGPHGMRLQVPRDLNPAIYEQFWRGLYEQPETRLMRAHFHADHTIVDLGANLGYVGAFALREKLLPGGRLVCVEANPDMHDCLAENIAVRARAGFEDRQVDIIRAALVAGSSGGKAAFMKLPTLSSHVLNGESLHQGGEVICVDTVTMDALAARYAPDGYSLICDIEGGETALLESPEALAGCRQMMVELHQPELVQQGSSVDDAIRRFEDMGFELRGRDHQSYAFARPAP